VISAVGTPDVTDQGTHVPMTQTEPLFRSTCIQRLPESEA
jgi:hypothetical protein